MIVVFLSIQECSGSVCVSDVVAGDAGLRHERKGIPNTPPLWRQAVVGPHPCTHYLRLAFFNGSPEPTCSMAFSINILVPK